jgi:hypothetical protein
MKSPLFVVMTCGFDTTTVDVSLSLSLPPSPTHSVFRNLKTSKIHGGGLGVLKQFLKDTQRCILKSTVSVKNAKL